MQQTDTQLSEIDEIVALSREYGAGNDWVIAGGGNTSIKTREWMWVKSSGTTLADITAEQFVKMDRTKLNAIWETTYPEDSDERERRALADLMAARASSEEKKRPSVETLMHALFPHRIVFHTHPTRVNGLTCSADGEEMARKLFGDQALWIPTVDPGYILARTIYDLVESRRKQHDGVYPPILIMQNHGLVVVGETSQKIRALNSEVIEAIDAVITARPQIDPVKHNPPGLENSRAAVTHAVAKAAEGAPAADEPQSAHSSEGVELPAPVTRAFTCPELELRISDTQAIRALDGSLSPDHIVYSGHRPCIVRTIESESLEASSSAAVRDYLAREEVLPKVVLFPEVRPGPGAVSVGSSETKAHLAELLFLDALKVLRYTESFGGVKHLPPDQEAFILGWEVEKFREEVSTR